MFDIQPDQLPTLNRELAAAGYRAAAPAPIVPMRIQSIKGRPVLIARTDTLDPAEGEPGPRNNWAVRREYRSTYRDTLVASERLIDGRWWTRAAGPTQISVERDLARELGVGLGDEIVWDIQGVPLTTRVASLREVDWARFEPNFFVVFAPGRAGDGAADLCDAHAGSRERRSAGSSSGGSPNGCPMSRPWTCRRCRRPWSG